MSNFYRWYRITNLDFVTVIQLLIKHMHCEQDRESPEGDGILHSSLFKELPNRLQSVTNWITVQIKIPITKELLSTPKILPTRSVFLSKL